MNTRKIKAAILGICLTIGSFGPIGDNINWKKVYIYKEDSAEIGGNIEPVYSQEASNYSLPSRISYYKKSGKITFSEKKNLFAFKAKRSALNNDLKFFIFIDGVKKEILTDDDGDERMLLDEYIYSEPIFFGAKKELTYEINSKEKANLSQEIKILGIDTESYNEKLTIGNTEEANAETSDIVSRSSWGADETLRYEDNPKWVAIYKQIAVNASKPKTAWEIKQDDKIRNIRSYLSTNFPLEDNPVTTIKKEGDHNLVWPIEKTKRIEKIFIHHTAESLDGDSRDDATLVRGIYYYHAMTKGWGDIGYNYLIGRDGKVYEGRAGGDYSVAAHNLWNNKSTLGISVIGNFESSKLETTQKIGVDYAIGIMAKKYGIDINKTSISHKECPDQNKCILNDYQTANLVGHKDAGYTSCPGINLYSELGEFKENAKAYSFGLNYIDNLSVNTLNVDLPKGPNIKIRLSYTGETVQIQSYTPESMKIEVGNVGGYVKLKYLNFETRTDNKIALVIGRKSLRLPYIKISSTVLEIPSWSRKPAWDKSGLINDNKFRGSIYIYNDNGKIMLVNELPLENYLKGIAEISNDENEQKAKTILVAARSYALWYTSPNNRKFPGKDYDGSDNPDEFQKYVGYSFEERSVNIGTYVDETNSVVIKYNGSLIKPWYFNQSSGKTKSYMEYCTERVKSGSLPTSTACDDVPYLQSVTDPGETNGAYKGHGVGISGAGAKALALAGTNYDDIIKYFLVGTAVEKTQY